MKARKLTTNQTTNHKLYAAKTTSFCDIIYRAGQVRKLVRKSANPQLRTNEKSCGHADLRTLAV